MCDVERDVALISSTLACFSRREGSRPTLSAASRKSYARSCRNSKCLTGLLRPLFLSVSIAQVGRYVCVSACVCVCKLGVIVRMRRTFAAFPILLCLFSPFRKGYFLYTMKMRGRVGLLPLRSSSLKVSKENCDGELMVNFHFLLFHSGADTGSLTGRITGSA